MNSRLEPPPPPSSATLHLSPQAKTTRLTKSFSERVVADRAAVFEKKAEPAPRPEPVVVSTAEGAPEPGPRRGRGENIYKRWMTDKFAAAQDGAPEEVHWRCAAQGCPFWRGRV